MALPFNFEGDEENSELIFSQNFLTIEHSGASDIKKICVRTQKPIPPSCELFYFEVTILQMNGNHGRVGVGFKEIHNSKYSLPGEQFDSYGLLTDGFFRCHRSNKVSSAIPSGCTIGCGLDFTYKRIFFTLKGKRLGHSIGIPIDHDLYPSVGIAGGAKVQANFGLTSFQYNLREYTAYCQENSTHWLNRPMIGPFEKSLQSLTVEETLCRKKQCALFSRKSHMQLPQHWHLSDRRRSLLLSKCGFSVILEGMGRSDEEAATVRSNVPIPSSCRFYYYEVRIDSCGQSYGRIDKGTISIGFCSKDAPLYELPGWNSKSLGYHGNNGNFFGRADWAGSDYGPTFKNGDVIGCMLNFDHKEYFFTRNGKRLGNVNALMNWKTSSVFESNVGIYPAVGMVNKYAEVSANFGQRSFCFDVVRYAEKLEASKLTSKIIRNKGQQKGYASPYLLNSSSSSCSPCNSVFSDIACEICNSTDMNAVTILNCDRCELSYHISCLVSPPPHIPTEKKKEWLCSKCQIAIDEPCKVPVYPDVSPIQISTRVHPLRRLSGISLYQPLTQTLSCLAVDNDEGGQEVDVQDLSQNPEDAPLNGVYQGLRTADLFRNLGDDVLVRNTKLQYAIDALQSRKTSNSAEEESFQRVEGRRNSGISNTSTTSVSRARRNSAGPKKRRRTSTPAPCPTPNHGIQLDEGSNVQQTIQRGAIQLTESSVQAGPSQVNIAVQTPTTKQRTAETQTNNWTLEVSDRADHKMTSLDMGSQTTEHCIANTDISHMKQIFYHYLKPKILKQCKKVDDFICQKKCKQAIEQIDRDFPEVFEKKKELRLLLEIFDFSDRLWRLYGPTEENKNEPPSEQPSHSKNNADVPSTSGTSTSMKTRAVGDDHTEAECLAVPTTQIVVENELKNFGGMIKHSIISLRNTMDGQTLSSTLIRAEESNIIFSANLTVIKEAFKMFWATHLVAQGSYLYSQDQRERLSEYVLLCIIFGFSQLRKGMDDI